MRAWFLALAFLAAPAAAQVSNPPDLSSYTGSLSATAFSSPNISMPNGANLAHTIFQGRPVGGFLSISGTTEQTVFSSTGDGNLTIQPAAMFVGARFHLHDRGRATTGLANVSTITSRLKIGSVTLVTGTTLGLPASLGNIPFWSDIDCKVLSVGVSGLMLCYGALHYGTGISSGPVLMSDMSNSAAITINTTVAQTWDATVQLSSVIGTPSIVVYDAFIIQEN